MHCHHASPLRRHTAVHQCDAFGAALCRGCAAALSPMPTIEPSLFLRQDVHVPQVLAMLPTIISVRPIPLLFLWASLRDQAAHAEPAARSPPFGRASLAPSLAYARCASLARRFASLTAGCLTAASVPGVGAVAIPPPESISLAVRARLVSGCAVALRLASPALAVANAASLTSRLMAFAQSPQRLPTGSLPEPISPFLDLGNRVLSHGEAVSHSHPTQPAALN